MRNRNFFNYGSIKFGMVWTISLKINATPLEAKKTVITNTQLVYPVDLNIVRVSVQLA